MEELRLVVEVGTEVANPAGGRWPIYPAYAMRLWFARIAAGRPRLAGAHDAVPWLVREELLDVDWLPADVAVVQHLHQLLS